MTAAETRCRAACPPRDGETWVEAVERVAGERAHVEGVVVGRWLP